MDKDTIYGQDVIDAINTLNKFGVDERSRIIRWHEGLEPYVHLRDVLTAIVNLPPAQYEIVRCKDCKWYSLEFCHCNHPRGLSFPVLRSDNHCSLAEMRVTG